MCRDDKAAPPCLRSLTELTRDYEERQGARHPEACATLAEEPGVVRVQHTGTLKSVFRSKGFGFIAEDGGSGDVFLHFSELRSGGIEALVVGQRVRYGKEPGVRGAKARATQAELLPTPARSFEETPKAAACYSREEMLSVFAALRVNVDQASACLHLHTRVVVPQPEKRRRRQKEVRQEEDPALDDEALIGIMEDRLSRESGSDDVNEETFGETCAGGWSFEEALKANEAIAERAARTALASPPPEAEEPAPSTLRAEAPCFEMPPTGAPCMALATAVKDLASHDFGENGWGNTEPWGIHGMADGPQHALNDAWTFNECPSWPGFPKELDRACGSTDGGSEDASSASEASHSFFGTGMQYVDDCL